ncbi:MAG TPA: FtsX-like permease family protein [Thermoanaerobaculia bacterium]|nr:FtsX-like permease family protein [Thermoanaerobaculia bacterium]
MPFPVELALRYLKSTRRDAFASFLSAVAAIGLAIGVAFLVLTLAAMSGFQGVLIDEVLARSPRLLVELPAAAGKETVERARRALAGQPEVAAVHETVRGQGWIVVRGLARAVEMTGFSGPVPPGYPGAEGGEPGLYLDSTLAGSWGIEPGDPVEVVSPVPTLVPFGPPQPRVRTVPLAGTFRAPRTQEDRSRIALPLDLARSLLPDRPRALAADLPIEAAPEIADRLAGRLPEGATVRTWQEINRSLFFVLKLEKALMFVAVALIVLVAAFALVADLALIVSSKRAEIGMLGAMGAPPGMVRRTFVLVGALLAAAGAGTGTLLGVGASWVLDRYRLIQLPGQVYVFDYVPFDVRPADLAVVLALTVVLALSFSWYAAQRAAALVPVEALRR